MRLGLAINERLEIAGEIFKYQVLDAHAFRRIFRGRLSSGVEDINEL